MQQPAVGGVRAAEGEEPNIHSKLLEEEQALERRIQQLTADWKAKRPTGAGNVPFRAISSIEWI